MQPQCWLKRTSKQPDMSFTSIGSGQKQILPQKSANKKAIRQNNGVVTKWPFSLNISLGSTAKPWDLSSAATKVSAHFCIATTMQHTNMSWFPHTHTHAGSWTTHRMYRAYLLCWWKGYVIFECCCINALWGLPITNRCLVCQPVALNHSVHNIALTFQQRWVFLYLWKVNQAKEDSISLENIIKKDMSLSFCTIRKPLQKVRAFRTIHAISY